LSENAGFWKRFAAIIIDGFILSVINAMLGRIVSGYVSILTSWLYFALFESSSSQATIGKMILGIIVTDLEGNKITFTRATGRYFSKILSAMILCIGYILAGITERKQALHDMIAGTLVVNK
jgi:uncharacterized RDD family membrane protein YckC